LAAELFNKARFFGAMRHDC